MGIFHQYTVYEHIVRAVGNYGGDDLSVKIALLLHDIGKPQCYTEDENGGHFYGHAVPSTDIARDVLERLRFDNKTKSEVLELIFNHDAVIEPTQRVVRRCVDTSVDENTKQFTIDVLLDDGIILSDESSSSFLFTPAYVFDSIQHITSTYNREEYFKAQEENREPVYLPKFSAHILRHTFCTRLCENERNLKIIQDVMGHRNIRTTMDVYNEATESKKLESFSSLDGKIKLM